jgi:hypothetical protein
MDIKLHFKGKGIKITDSDSGWHSDYGVALVYPAAIPEMIKWAEAQIQAEIPVLYKEFLLMSNGAFYKNWSLYGIPPSRFRTGMFGETLECLDITLANPGWKSEFNLSKADWLMIGAIKGFEENTGIFLDAEGTVFLANTTEVREAKDFTGLIESMTA